MKAVKRGQTRLGGKCIKILRMQTRMVRRLIAIERRLLRIESRQPREEKAL